MVLVVSPYSCFQFSSRPISTFDVFAGLIYVTFLDGGLATYQIPSAVETGMDLFDETKLVLEDLNAVGKTQLSGRALQLQFLPNLGYLVVLLENQTVQLLNLTDYEQIDKFEEARFGLIKTWYEDSKDLHLDQLNEEDNDYITADDMDTISLATTALETTRSKKFINTKTGNSFLCLVSKRTLAIIKWHNNQYERKYEFKLNDKIQLVEFLNADNLIAAMKNGDLCRIDLPHQSVSPIQIQFLNQPSGFNKSFFFSSSDSVGELFKANNDQQLIIFKDHNLIKLNSDLELVVYRHHAHSIDFKNPVVVPGHNESGKKLKFLKYWFPYLVLVYSNSIEIWNLENGSLVQQLPCKTSLQSIVDIKFSPQFLFLVGATTVFKLVKSSYEFQLSEFEKSKDYNNALNLIEKLNPLVFQDDTDSHSPRQIKFLKLRQFELLKGLEYLKNHKYDTAIKLFIDFLASPETLLDNLPPKVKSLLADDPTLKHTSSRDSLRSSKDAQGLPQKESKIISLCITYLTDARRKLIRLLDPDSPKFQWHGFLISSELYGTHDLPVLEKKLELVDNCLFQCYLLTNSRMVGPLLRISNYCSFDKIEKKCLKLQMYTELVDFYYCRARHDKALELLEKLCFEEKVFKPEFMVKYIQKLGRPQQDLVFSFSKKLIDLNPLHVDEIFMDDSIECESLDKVQVLEFLSRWPVLQVRYLRYLIFDLGETNVRYPNKLIELYLQDPEKNQAHIHQLYSLGNYTPNGVLKQLNSLQPSPAVLDLMILPLGKLNKHNDVLDILINKLDNTAKALQYCVAIHDNSPDTGIELTNTLLDMLLSQKKFASVLEILDSGITFVDPTQVLAKLPDTLLLKELSKYLETNMRSITSLLRQDIITSELLKVQLVNIKYEKLETDRVHVRLDSASRCAVCGKNFSAASILSFFSNGTVVHYGCAKHKTG
ncbi:hypothetical protein OGAPHI_006546 [Ogataea philodendri]|uniref:CNH domain-containing protein n=1 Tax=Ogataea philodendri TaxID=1378263 RepID=A0A9P8T0Q1_9ASCO|nr:uncharacterized protein OGAPHI_006546 [Ogataea philodendri]KAH3661696.1 hypothetical protein OGAPHI_006546 [Ogataea philodendri]